jgi:hypothetical protein
MKTKKPVAPVAKAPKKIPFDFVLDELAELSPVTRPMFGCTSVYIGEKIVMVLRDKEGDLYDNGIWIATTEAHHAALRVDLPIMRSIKVFGEGVTGWQVLPADDDRFEEHALRACEIVRVNDPRIGKIPASKKPASKKPTAKKTATKKK